MIDSQVIAYAGMALILTLIPGADTMLVIRNVIARGPAAGIVTTLGICSGCLAQGALAAFGLSAIIARSAEVFGIVKTIGAAYLVYLGIQSLRQARRPQPLAEGVARGRSFAEGFTTNLLNPKVALFYLAVLPQFLSPTDGFAKSALLAAIHAALGFVWLSTVSLFLATLRGWLMRPRWRQSLEAVTGVVLIGLGVRLAFARR